MFPTIQLGVATYSSVDTKSTNLNFTDNKMSGIYPRYGFVVFDCGISGRVLFSFINIFNCEYNKYGSFTVSLNSEDDQAFILFYSNFINNSQIDDEPKAQLVIVEIISNNAFFEFSDICCNSKDTFFRIEFSNQMRKNHVYLYVFDSLFGCSFNNFIVDNDYLLLDQSENIIFNYSDFNVDITNNIISNFGYVQTSIFSASNVFTQSVSSFDFLDTPFNVKIISIIIGIISFISFFLILCFQGKTNKIDINQFEQLEYDNELENISINEREKNSDLSDSKDKNSSLFVADTNILNETDKIENEL